MRHKHRTTSRTVRHAFTGTFREVQMESLLERAATNGCVLRGEYDTGRGSMVWFSGWPGAEMRELVADVRSLILNCEVARSGR